MSRSVVCPVSVSAAAPESLSVLQRRLQTAEQQTEELVRTLGSLGASADQQHLQNSVGTRPISPVNIQRAPSATGESLLWRQCETLVARVCRLESVLHALKLTAFRLETERQLNPSHPAGLQERLISLQEQHEREQRASLLELLRLQDELQQTREDRQEAQREVIRLTEALENTMSSQVEILQRDCHALRLDGHADRAELKKREEKILDLQRECQQLRDQSGVKEILISQLTKEIKCVKTVLQKQQQENSRLIRDGRDLRAAADQVQAERDRVSKHLKEQDLLLDTARRNIQAELQRAITEKLSLQKELETLKVEHSRLQQSSVFSQETAVNHLQMLEQTIERLKGEIGSAVRDGEMLREERDHIHSQMSSAVCLLEKEKNILETQLTEIKAELTTVNSALQKQTEENKELMESLAAMEHQQVTHRQVEQMLWEMTDGKNKLAYEKGKLQARVQQMAAELKTLKAECAQHCQTKTALENSYTQTQRENQALKDQLQQQHRDMNEVAQTLENVLSSHTHLQHNTQTLNAELRETAEEMQTLRRERLEAMQEIQRLEDKVENHNAANTEKVESLQKALDEAQLDNRKLGQSLEQALQENHNTRQKLNTVVESREAELKEAKDEIRRLTEQLDSLKNLLNREKEFARKSAHRLKKALNDASVKSGDLSQANQELREKVSELEKQVFNQKSQLNQYVDKRTALSNSLRIKDLETEIKDLEEAKDEYKKRSYEQSQCLLRLRSEMVSLQSELISLSSSQQGELQAQRETSHKLQEKCQLLEERLKLLQDERDDAEIRLREVCMESQEITENMDEDHRGLRSKSHSFNDEPQKLTESLWRMRKERSCSTPVQTRVCFFDPELEPWASALQRWEIKKELGRIAGNYKPRRHVRTLTT
ncbi:coiled-coil domain-containing protein 150 isoform X13 [Danio rerio]